jgi:ribose/xylose/arabinose/galactoside ABC-type transport system permease subunit
MSDNSLARAAGSGRSSTLAAFGRNWALFFLLIMIVVFSFTGKNFLTLANFQTIIYSATISLLLAFAETFVIIARGIDLSVGYVMGLSTITCAGVIRDLYAAQFGVGWPAGVAIVIGILAGLAVSVACGMASGLLVSRFRVPPFIATLGVLGVAYGFTLHMSDGGFPIGFLPQVLTEIGNGYVYYDNPALDASSFFAPPMGTTGPQIKGMLRLFPNSLILILVFLAVLWHLLKNTRFGQHTYAIGGSLDASVRAGIDTRRHLLMVYVLSAFLSGLAGIVAVFQTGQGNFVPMGSNLELFAIAAVIIGGASMNGGKGRIIASLVGVFIISIMANGLTLSGVETFYRFIATGVILIVAIVVDQLFPDLF